MISIGGLVSGISITRTPGTYLHFPCISCIRDGILIKKASETLCGKRHFHSQYFGSLAGKKKYIGNYKFTVTSYKQSCLVIGFLKILLVFYESMYGSLTSDELNHTALTLHLLRRTEEESMMKKEKLLG